MNVITSNTNSIDRISNLPDPILCHILSFLTTKEAAATSVLSKQWRYLWILVPDIHVNEREIRRNGLYGFKHVIYNILLRKPPSNIRKIRLQSNTKSNHQFLSIFLSRAPACNVEELDLHVWNWVDHNSNKRVFFKLPRGVFSYEKLVILKLTREICVDVVSNSVQLPSLKVLHLLCVRYKGDESVRSLISGCLVLDDLLVKRAKLDGVISSYDISSRTLTNVCVDCRDLDFGSIKLHKIDAPALKYLTLIDPLLSSFQFSNFDNLVEANIHVGYRIKACEREAMADMFRALCNVKSMQLKSIFKALLNTHDYQHTASFKKLPTFHNLVTLKLSDIYCVGCIFKGLLPKFPRLEHLTILKVQRCYCCDVLPRPMPSEFVPTCLSFRLTTFKLQKFEGLQLEMDFIKCLLKNSKNLMNITIIFSSCLSSLNKFRFQKKISRFEKRSSRCQLSFEEGKNM